jgi:hypothetical protein
MSYTIRNSTINTSLDPKPSNYWKRNKKAEVSLLHGTPFVLERQLEDQKCEIEYNKVNEIFILIYQ